MEWFNDLLWGGGVAHSVILLSLVIVFGILLGKVRVAGISLGITFVLFVGIVMGHFGLTIDPVVMHFFKEFGLILFVYSIGMQVGPGFFSSFKRGGITLNLLAASIVLLGVTLAPAIDYKTSTSEESPDGIITLDGFGPIGAGFHSEKEYLEIESIEPRVALLKAVLEEIAS